MAISNNTKNKYQQYNNPYVESEAQKQQREIAQQLAYSQPNNAPNNYAQQMQEMYNRVASKGAFSYDKANDKAYQQYAKMYQQLGGLSMAATQQAANELTAGYGSTYSPQVAMQTDNAYQANVNSALPSYYQMAQNEYDALRQKDLTNYEAAIKGYQNAENSNLNRKNAWADIVNSAAERSNQENANAVNNYADNKSRFSTAERSVSQFLRKSPPGLREKQCRPISSRLRPLAPSASFRWRRMKRIPPRSESFLQNPPHCKMQLNLRVGSRTE